MPQPLSTRAVEIIDDAEGPTESASAFHRSLAVIIGINDYGNGIPRLETPVNDAEQVAAILEREQKFVIQEKLTADVSRAKLVTLFSETLPALNLDKQDRLLVYFAGHGVSMQGADGEPQYFLIPQDARAADVSSFLPMREVREWLLQLDCRHLLLMLDCCFAGGFGRMRALDNPPPVIYRQRYNFYRRSAAWQVIASAAHDETALDTAGGFVFGRRYTGATPNNSPFALALIDALRGEADTNPPTHPGEPNGDGLITVTEVLSFVRDRVQAQADEISHRQTPALWSLLPKHQAGEYFFGNPQRALQLQDAPALTADTNPYRGLKSYEQAQSELFFGRGKQIQQLRELAEQHSFLAVLGASGTGKSSLVKAGLVPTLSNAYVMRPTDTPLPALEKLLAHDLPNAQVNFVQDENALRDFVAAWHEKYPGRRLILVIDQFEELVTLCDESERKQFQNLLANALRTHADVLCVILTLRTDFEPSFANGPLQEFWKSEGARYIVPPMTQDDLRQVIVGPSLKREVYFESSALVETLINEVIQMPGGLPLLSFALSEMYLQYLQSGRQDRTLSQHEYQNVGGVIGSLRNAANKVYTGLADDRHRSMMERVMLRMVAIEGGEVARRRVSTAELDYGAQENPLRENVIDTLTNARLVVNGGEANTTWTEPAHDALISGWDRLMEWKLRAAPYLPLQREIAPAALRWQAADGKDKTALLWNNDPRLSQLQDTLWRTNDKALPNNPSSKTRANQRGILHPARQLLFPRTDTPTDPQWLNQPEVAFVQSSVKRRSLVFWIIIGTTLSIILLLTVATLIANGQRIEAERQATISDSRRLAAQSSLLRESNLDASSLLGIQGIKLDDNYETRNSLLTTLQKIYEAASLRGQQSSLNSLAFSPDGNLLASASGDFEGHDNSIQLWDVRDVAHPQALGNSLVGHTGPVYSVVFSPDGTLLASASADHTIRLWDIRDKVHPQSLGVPLTGHTSAVNSLAFSPDGKTLASASGGLGERDNTVRLWDTSDVAHVQALGPPLAGHTNTVVAVAFSPDGKTLVSASDDNTIRIWDMQDRMRPQAFGDPIEVPEGSLKSITFSPDGKTLASGSCGELDPTNNCIAGKIQLWDMSELTRPQALGTPLTGHARPVSGLAFSPDGTLLASASWDRTIRLWDVSSPKHPQSVGLPLTGHADLISSVLFSADSKTLVTASHDQTIRLWNVNNSVNPFILGAPLTGHRDFVKSVVYSPDGMVLASASDDGTIHLWDLRDVQHPQAIEASLEGHRMAFSPDSKMLALVSDRVAIRLWDVSDVQHPQPLGAPFIGHTNVVESIVFSSDGKTLASAGRDKTIRLWDVSDVYHPQPLGAPLIGHTGFVTNVAFSPNGKILASAGDDGTVRLWDVSDVQHPQSPDAPLAQYERPVFSVAFSPDSKTLAAGNMDTTIHFWDVSDMRHPQALGVPLVGHGHTVASLAFSRDSKLLASGSWDSTIRLWDVTDVQHPQVLGTPLSADPDYVSSVVFSPDGKTLAAASWSSAIWLWNVDMNIGTLQTRVCTRVNRNLTREEYRRYFNSNPSAYDTVYAKNPTCPGLPAEPLPTPMPSPTP